MVPAGIACLSIIRVCLNEELVSASARSDVPRMRQLIFLGANPNGEDFEGHCTPLGMAVHHSQPGAVIYLLQCGADPTLPSGRDYPPSRLPKTGRILQ